MATTAINTYTGDVLTPAMKPESAVEIAVRLAVGTYSRGQVLGEVLLNDTYTLTLGAQASGNYTLTFGGQTTANIAFNANAAAITAALTALTTVGAGNATVTGTGPFTITFTAALGNKPNGPLTANFAGLATPGNASLVQATVGQVAGTYRAYAAGNTDGSQLPTAVLRRACAVDAQGNITYGAQTGGDQWGITSLYTDAFIRGIFFTQDLVGLDANALGKLGFMRQGTITLGLVDLV